MQSTTEIRGNALGREMNCLANVRLARLVVFIHRPRSLSQISSQCNCVVKNDYRHVIIYFQHVLNIMSNELNNVKKSDG